MFWVLAIILVVLVAVVVALLLVVNDLLKLTTGLLPRRDGEHGGRR